MKVDLKPEIEAGLLAQARARGLSLEAYVRGRTGFSRPPGEVASRGRKSLARLFAESPLKGLNLAFERDQDQGRPLKR
jgi:hypothetical protein